MASSAAAAPAFDFAPTANVQYELARFDPDQRDFRDTDDFRRARFGFRIKAGERWQFAAEHDFADRTPADAFVEFTPAKGHALRLGQFKQPFLLEDAVSDKTTPLLEPSLVGVFAISRRIGLEYARFGERGTLNAALFGKRLDGTSESLGATLRGTWALPAGATHAHVGLSLATESPDNGRASFSAGPGSALTDLRLASTGGITAVDHIDRGAVEGLWIASAWSLQGELAAVATRGDGADFRGNAQSLLVTWSPSGDGRTYKRGVSGAPGTADGPAWELALRWSAIDLDHGTVAGGRVEHMGVGATCYVNKHVRVGANLLRVESTRRGVADDPLVAGLRLQLTY
jgi:phosphate-selective porin OprO/OprP